MITLTELIHSIGREKKDGLVKVDDWRWPDIDHLITMGFEFTDDHHLATGKEPKITVYKKNETIDGKETSHFFVEEEGRENKRFANFSEVIDYFDKYSQPELDKNK